MKKLLFLLVMLLPFSVMAQFKYISLNRGYEDMQDYSKKDIPVYFSKKDLPKGEIIEIGLISCDGFSDNKRFKKAKKMAAKHGASGIYIVSKDEETDAIRAALGRRKAHETRFIAFVIKDRATPRR